MDIQRLRRSTAAPLVRGKTDAELVELLRRRLPPLGVEDDCARWKELSAAHRARFLDLYLRGHPQGLLTQTCAVEWRDVLEPCAEYRIRKLLFEGYPGLQVPALLYEPAGGGASAKLPVVLNAQGHHAGGMAVPYAQARCINLARRGMLALSFELLGMGELSAMRDHTRIAQLDITGMEGAGVFFLVMKRALDVLLSQPRADETRVAMTGFSGGGWQTIVLSALDPRITASIPVAGHTPVWQRIHNPPDVGDGEQLPVDFCTAGDYDTLSAMLAPRPTLFIYNHADTCCFQTERARVSVFEPARRYFSLLGAADRVELYDNTDPGTHNYDRDSRERLYGFLKRTFGLSAPEAELPWEDELYGEEELRVGVPPDNATLLSIARKRAGELAAQRRASHQARPLPEESRGGARTEESRAGLRRILRLPEISAVVTRSIRAGRMEGLAVRQLVAGIGGWSVPMIHARPARRAWSAAAVDAAPARAAAPAHAAVSPEGPARAFFTGGERVLAVEDTGRQEALARALLRCPGAQGKGGGLEGPTPDHLVAMDIFGTGEMRVFWKKHMLLAAAGERPLGIQAAMIISAARWMRDSMGGPVTLQAGGMTSSVAALTAAALEPALFRGLFTDGLPVSLSCLIEWPVAYEEAPPLFCFGLLERFDIPDLVRLAHPVRVQELTRGPLP